MESDNGAQVTAGSEDLETALKPLTKCFRIFALSSSSPEKIKSRKDRILRWIHIIYCLFIFVTSFCSVVQCFFVIYSEKLMSGLLILAFAMHGIFIVINQVIFYWKITKILPNVLSKFREHKLRMKKASFMLKAQKYIQILTWSILGTAALVSSSSIYIFTRNVEENSVSAKLLMSNMSDNNWFLLVRIFTVFMSFIIIGQAMVDLLLYLVFCKIFHKDFDRVASEIKQEATDQTSDFFNTLELYRQEYELITQTLQLTNQIFSLYLLTFYTKNLSIICFLLYRLIRENTFDDFIYAAFATFIELMNFTIITLAGLVVNKKAHEPVDYLLSISLDQWPQQANVKLLLFFMRLTSTNIGISVGGLFTIDNSALLTMIGTMLTYIVVVIQTKPGKYLQPACDGTEMSTASLMNFSSTTL